MDAAQTLPRPNGHFSGPLSASDDDLPPELCGRDRFAAKPVGKKAERPRFELISSVALDAEDYTPRPIVTEALFAGVPAVIGAPFKTCKSLIAFDAAISGATGRPWLGAFTVPTPLTVVYFSGEGGACVAQEYGRRIAKSKGISLADATQLHWCFSVPRLEDLRDLKAFEKILVESGAEVAFLDNLMLCLSGDDAGNVYKMGSVLGNAIRICADHNVTPVFVHHFKRQRSTADPFAPGELSDLTQAGVAEVAGQWWLLTRRKPFDPECPGEHQLWLSIGGRVGHSSLHALDIEEGRRTDPEGRHWEVAVRAANEVRHEREASQDNARREKMAAKRTAQLEGDRKEIVGILAKLKRPETKNKLRDMAAAGHTRFATAFASLVAEGVIQEADLKNELNGQHYNGWGLRSDE